MYVSQCENISTTTSRQVKMIIVLLPMHNVSEKMLKTTRRNINDKIFHLNLMSLKSPNVIVPIPAL